MSTCLILGLVRRTEWGNWGCDQVEEREERRERKKEGRKESRLGASMSGKQRREWKG